MNKLILLIPALWATSASPNPIADACKRDIPQVTINKIRSQNPKVSTPELKEAMDGKKPLAEYATQARIASCVAEKMALALKDRSNFNSFCMKNPTGLRIDCFNRWLRKQDVSYASQVVELSLTAYNLAEEDKRTSKNKALAFIILQDTLLTTLERYSVRKNVAFKFDKATHAERLPLRNREYQDYAKAKKEILDRVDIAVNQKGPPVRGPASVKKPMVAGKKKFDLQGLFNKRIAALRKKS